MSEFSPRTPEEVFQNFKGRQAGINKALNDDVVRARASEPRSLFFSPSPIRAKKFEFNIENANTPRALSRIAIQVREIWEQIQTGDQYLSSN